MKKTHYAPDHKTSFPCRTPRCYVGPYWTDKAEDATCDRCRKAAGLTFRIEVAPAVFTMPAGKA